MGDSVIILITMAFSIDKQRRETTLIHSSNPTRNLTKPMKYAILAADNIDDSHPRREVSKHRCQGYVLMSPFFQDRKNGFLLF